MSNYLLELGAIHLVLILGYWFLLRKERQYHKLRGYLVGASVLSLIIPLLKLPKLFSFGSEEPVTQAVTVQPLTIHAIPATPQASSFEWNPEMLLWAYLAISAFFLLKFLANVFQIISLERRSSHETFHDITVRKVPNIQGSFTFFKWIFLNETINKDQSDYQVILKHENAHVTMGHSWDLLFLELFKVCFWWLPTIWFINKEIRKIHEYQADAHALKTYEVDHYSSILISSTLATHGLSLASSFHDGFIFKRLNAMKQKAKRVSPWKLGALMAVSVMLVIGFACSEEIDQDIQWIGSKSNNIGFDQLPADMQAKLADIKDELVFISVDIPEDGGEIEKIKELQELDPELMHTININRELGKIHVAIRKDGNSFAYVSDASKIHGELFTIVEEQPEYAEGMPSFYKKIAQEIRYPKEARANGIEGTVNLQFVVERDGSLSDIEVLDGIGYGCDVEAMRVVQQMDAFKPGKQRGKTVRVRMVMPIVFKLQGEDSNPDGTPYGSIILEEIQADQQKLTVDAKFSDGTWSGTVRDQSGELLPGANIIVAGTNRGVVSDFDGSFTLAASSAEELHVSFVGYESLKLQTD